MKKLLFFIIILLSITVYSQEKRLALVIGNSAYQHGGVLKNPVNDAMAMKKALVKVGFEVMEYFNLNQSEMKRAIDDFGLKLKNYEVGLFFYAGHGIQAKGNNHLIPIDANLLSENDVEYDCVPAGRVLGKMEDASSKTNIIILDACRNNPFERGWTRSSTGQGLAFMDAPSGTIISYATAPGSVASDGIGINGLYTSAILESIQIPNITILKVFQNVRIIVSEESNHQQIPWESTSLIGDFYFNISQTSNTASLPDNILANDILLSSDDFGSETQGVFLDSRDNQTYGWIRVGEDYWMTENLNYETDSGSWCNECDVYGRLYNYETAKSVCPEGWYTPDYFNWWLVGIQLYNTSGKGSRKKEKFRGLEYSIVYKNMGGDLKEASFNHWRSPNKGAVNKFGFNVLPSGVRMYVEKLPWSFTSNVQKDGKGNILTDGEEAFFWLYNREGNSLFYNCAFLRFDSSDFFIGNCPEDWECSVRCVKEQP